LKNNFGSLTARCVNYRLGKSVRWPVRRRWGDEGDKVSGFRLQVAGFRRK